MAESGTEQLIERFRGDFEKVRAEIAKAIVGHEDVVEGTLTCLFANGHVLLEGVPGLGKTMLIRTLSQALQLKFSRIQFTPDLMPADVTGTTIVVEGDHGRDFQFRKGPIFAQIVLADEINRATPKTQSALLEAMQERSVTVGGVTHQLDKPFLVMATQNPIEQEGTYPLPEAQLDRFMLNIRIGYPTEAEEMEIVARTTGEQVLQTGNVLGAEDLSRAQSVVRRMPIAEHVMRHALRIVRATRVKQEAMTDAPMQAIVRDYVAWGAGPRASQFLVLAAKAKALLSGDSHVEPRHLHAVALPVLRHRIVTNFNAEADGVTSETIIERLIDDLPVVAADGQPLDRLIR